LKIIHLLKHGVRGNGHVHVAVAEARGAMAAAFRKLMADEAVLADWRARAKDGAAHFTVARMTADYQHVYTDVAR
jgi:hypothetical protein